MEDDRKQLPEGCVDLSEDDKFLEENTEEHSTPSTASQCKRCMHVNRAYIPLKMIYFFFMAGEACAMPYRFIYMKHLGLSTKQTGVISTVERVISVILPPFLGAITDKSRRPKLVLIVLLLGGSMLLFSMYFVPQEQLLKVENNSTTLSAKEMARQNISTCWGLNCTREEKQCTAGSASAWESVCDDVSNLDEVETFQCSSGHAITTAPQRTKRTTDPTDSGSIIFTNSSAHPPTDKLSPPGGAKVACVLYWGTGNSTRVELAEEDAHIVMMGVTDAAIYLDAGRRLCVEYISLPEAESSCNEFQRNPTDEYGATFWLMFFLIVMSSCATIGTYPVMESGVLAALGPKNRHKFGQQRLWASVGYGSAALVVGYIKDRSSDQIGEVGSSNRPFLPMFVGVVICWVFASMVASRLPISTSKKERKKIKLKDIRFVLMKPKALAFFALLLFNGIDTAIQEVYLFWLAENKLNAPSSILGASTFVGALLDIPFCLSAGTLIRRFGHTALLCFSMMVLSMRIFFAGVITEAWQLIAVESLRCITWGLQWVVVCSYTAKISPPGLETLTMGITQATLWGLGYSAGALAGGVLFEVIGGDKIFLLFGSISMVAAILFGVFSFCTRNNEADDLIHEGEKENQEGSSLKGSTEGICEAAA